MKSVDAGAVLSSRNLSARWTAVALAALVVFATCLRFFHLGQKSYWWDEIVTIRIASLPFAAFRSTLWQYEANMSLYYLLARGWIHFGNDEAWLRSLSVIMAVASIPVIYAVGTVLSRKRTGLIAAFLLSINVAHIAYAQEARSYSLLMLLCLLSLLYFLRIDQTGETNALGYVLASTFAVYAHFFAVFFLFAQWTSLLWLPQKRLRWKKFLMPVSATAILLLPALYYMAFRRSSQLAFIPPLRPRELAQVIYVLTADAGKFRKAIALLYLFSCGVALQSFYLRWRSERDSFENWRVLAVALCATLPIAITFLISFKVPIFFPRYLLICLPALVLLAAYGLATMRRPWLRIGTLALVTLLSVATLKGYYAQSKDDWRSLTSYLSAQAQPGDAVVGCPAGAEWPVQYYLPKIASNQVPEVAYLTPSQLRDGLSNTSPENNHLPGSRIWLVDWGNSPDFKSLPQALEPEYTRLREQRFPGNLTVALYRARSVDSR